MQQFTHRQLLQGLQGLVDLIHPARLAGGQIGRLQAEGVVFVFGDVLNVGGGLIGRLRRALGDQQVATQAFDNDVLQLGFVHGRYGPGWARRITQWASWTRCCP